LATDQTPICGSDNPNTGVEELYPPGTEPEVRLDKISAICSFGHTPRLMTGIIRQILLQNFVDEQNVRNAHLRRYLRNNGTWSPGPDSGLYIESLLRWRPEMTEARPALVIKEGDWEWMRVGIGDHAGGDWRSGKESFLGYWKGTHTVFAIGGEGPETQILGAEVAKLLLWYSRTIQDQMSLHRFVPLQIGAPHAVQEATENYVVPVSVAYVAEEKWSTQIDAPRLKRIVFDIDELM
jgi:hypothetical protein